MRRRPVKYFVSLLFISLAAFIASIVLLPEKVAHADSNRITQGELQAMDSSGKAVGLCPLKHTAVRAEISGFLSRVRVTQEFENPFKEKIEAVYTFPLPQAAAVDDMTMTVGERTVRGRILRREEAQAVYAAARSNGQVASLLDQERPNIFTQSVANIMPGERVKVEITYVETLKYEDGTYEFVFPMVVGPRYIPGTPVSSVQQGGTIPNTDRVPDASRITPQVAPQGTRAGHDISLEVMLDAGVPLDSINSNSHEVEVQRGTASTATIRLKNRNEIPNRDFTLRYDVAGRRMADALLSHRSDRGGFFTLILQPPERVTAEDVTPKELVFVLDTSGSMDGFPIEKAKETMKLALDGLYPQDTFNLITFAGDTHILFEHPVAATPANLKRAQDFLASRSGAGGTEMMKAIRAALDPSDAQDHVRIVCFMTDGMVGNDPEIISEVQKHPNARVFAFGIGSSINRSLLDKMAEQGRGEVEYVSLRDDGSRAARKFHERVRNPLLTDISIDWSGLPVADVYPKRIPDLFGAKPVVLTGRYTGDGRGTIKLKGKMAGQDFVREIPVDLPATEQRHDVLATLWARTRIDELMNETYRNVPESKEGLAARETITQLGLEYRLMTQFTSFVAVEEMIVTDNGQPRRVEVPVELPEGVNGSNVSTEQFSNFPTTRTVQSLYVIAPTVNRSVLKDGRKVKSSSLPVNGRAPAAEAGKAGSTPPVTTSGAAVDGTISDGDAMTIRKEEKLTPEQSKRRELEAKTHPSIRAVIDRLNSKAGQPGADEAKFINSGQATIQVWLFDKTPEAIAELKQLGFEVVIDPKTSKVVIGRLPIEKLAALLELKSVRFVAPEIARN